MQTYPCTSPCKALLRAFIREVKPCTSCCCHENARNASRESTPRAKRAPKQAPKAANKMGANKLHGIGWQPCRSLRKEFCLPRTSDDVTKPGKRAWHTPAHLCTPPCKALLRSSTSSLGCAVVCITLCLPSTLSCAGGRRCRSESAIAPLL